MCMLSVIYDYGRKTWPGPWDTNPIVPPPKAPPIQPNRPFPTGEQFEALRRALEAAREFDDAVGEHDCEDPEKVAWFEAVEARLAALEADKGDTPGPHFSGGMQAIDAERFRQVQVLGYDAAHDATHEGHELVVYASRRLRHYMDPYSRDYDDTVLLVEAGALLAAEIDRRDAE